MAQNRSNTFSAEKYKQAIQCIDILSQSDDAKKQDAAFSRLREVLHNVSPEDLNNTRETIRPNWGPQNIAEYAIEHILLVVNSRSPQFSVLYKTLEIIIQCGILDTNRREKNISNVINSLVYPRNFTAPLTEMISEYEGNDVNFDHITLSDQQIEKLTKDKNYSDEEQKQVLEDARVKLIKETVAKQLAQNARKQEHSPLLHQVLSQRFHDSPAAIENVGKILELFYAHGADFNVRDHQKHTAMHIIAMKGNYRLALDLHIAGCGLNILDSQNKTAFDIIFETEKSRGEIGAARIKSVKDLGAKTAIEVNNFGGFQASYGYRGRSFMRLVDSSAYAVRPDSILRMINAGNVEDLAYYCQRENINLRNVVDATGRSCVDIMLANGTAGVFFANDHVRAAIQSQFPFADIRKCLDVVDREVRAKKLAEQAALEDSDVLYSETKKENLSSVAASSATLFSVDVISKLKLACAMKNFPKLKDAVKDLSPQALKAAVESVNKKETPNYFGDSIFNTLMDLLTKLKTESADAVPFSAEELAQAKRQVVAKALPAGIKKVK